MSVHVMLAPRLCKQPKKNNSCNYSPVNDFRLSLTSSGGDVRAQSLFYPLDVSMSCHLTPSTFP